MYIMNYSEMDQVEASYQKKFDALDTTADDFHEKYQELEMEYDYAMESCLNPQRGWREDGD